jgi:hypothetical protein
MIIKSFRIPTNYGHGRFQNHVFRGDDNESIALVQGTEKDAEDIFEDASRDGKTFAITHLIISPGAETTPEEMMGIVKDLAKEFDFDPTEAVIIEHKKKRVGGECISDRHWHVLIPDWNRDGDGTVVDNSHNWVRQSKIARLSEWKLGHPFVECPQMDAIVAALKRDGHRKAAHALAAAFPKPTLFNAAFTHAEAQAAKRAGVNLSEVRDAVRPLWRSTLTVDDFELGLAKHGFKLGVGTRKPPVWVITDAAGKPLMRVTKAAHATKADVLFRLGEANNGSRIEEELEPVRAPDDWIGGLEDDAPGDPGTAVGDRSVAAEPECGERSLSPGAFLEGLGAYVNRIDRFARSVQREIIPKSVRLEASLKLVESNAEAAITKESNFSIPESHLLKVSRRKLKVAEEQRRIARDRMMTAYDAFVALRKLPEPGFFGRSQHREQLENAEAKYLRLNEKCEAATAVRDKASLMVGALVDLHQSKLEKRLAPYKAAADLAREKKTVVALTRALIRKDPTLLRFGPRAVYNLAWAYHRREPGQVLWDGRVSIWGIPIEPPRVWHP